MNLPQRLNCTRCNEFTEWEAESTVEVTDGFEERRTKSVRCDECGKRHSTDSLFVIDPRKDYDRDEAGNLLDTPP